ncbi:RNA-directed DNA polymerase (Reverse transcriptase), partial [Trifolium medium]|nr:RNA-directed DNA polymerase (Reverse transcriptase) [Trifolium medium]
QTRKPHLIGWEVCCLPKIKGGLGISPHQMNEVFIMKMLWNMINKPDDLWCKVLYSKYGRDKDLQTSINAQPYNSSLWKVLAGIGKSSRIIWFGNWAMDNI